MRPLSTPPTSALSAALRLPAAPPRPRVLLWVVLVLLIGVAQTLLVVMTLRYEQSRAQERTEDVAATAQGEIRRHTQLLLQGMEHCHRFAAACRPKQRLQLLPTEGGLQKHRPRAAASAGGARRCSPSRH